MPRDAKHQKLQGSRRMLHWRWGFIKHRGVLRRSFCPLGKYLLSTNYVLSTVIGIHQVIYLSSKSYPQEKRRLGKAFCYLLGIPENIPRMGAYADSVIKQSSK